MKRLIAYVILLSLLALLLCSCSYKQNEWYTDETLSKCLLPDFSEPTENYVKQGDNIYLNFSEEEFEKYLNGVYEYLKSKDFEYLGTRGEFHNSLSGAFASYYFKEADELSEFYVDGDYRFVYSKEGKVDENRDPIFCILKISHFESVEILEINNGRNNFKYNTVIRLRHYSEEPLSGTYVLRDDNHDHTGEWIPYSQNSHYYEYTCGCTLPDRIENHVYNDVDTFCSICGYDTSDEPPCVEETIFLRNLTGCEWLNEITAEDIAEIKIISGAVGVAPGNPNNILSSTDETVIARIFEEYYWLDTEPISEENGQIDGGGDVTVKFTLKDGTAKELYINNGNYRDPNGNYFELLSTPKFKETDNATKTYGFITYIGTATVYDNDNNFVCEIPTSALEYVITGYDFSLFNNGYDYCIETEFGNLYFVKIEIFASDSDDAELVRVDYYFITEFDRENCYRLVGNNLDELIADATIGKYSLIMNDEGWLYEDLESTYKAGETVSVKIRMAYDLGYMLFVNGERVMEELDTDGPYWEFIFTMPESNVIIDFKTYDGFLPDENYAILYETFWMQNLDSDYVSIRHYYGEFDSGAIVAMIDSAYYTEALWSEAVGETVIYYIDGNRIAVLYDGVFYTLPEAYNNGYLTEADLTEIGDLHKAYNPYLYS